MNSPNACEVVLEVLNRATSQDTSVLKPAEQQLKEWETQPGFYSILQAIFSNHSIDVNVRWLAVLYFKNGIDRYWRRTAPNGSNCNTTSCLDRQSGPSGLPKKLAGINTTLLEAVKTPDKLAQQRALLTLHHVTKTLAAKRLATDRKLFQELTSGIFGFIYNLWNHHTEVFFQHAGQQDVTNMLEALELSILTLKILRKQLIYGIPAPDQVPDAVMVLKLTFDRLRSLLDIRNSFQNASHIKEKVEKNIIILGKMLLESQETFPVPYNGFIKHVLEFTTNFLFTDPGRVLLFERFTVQCMSLIKKIIKCNSYKITRAMEDSKQAAAMEAEKTTSGFFTNDVLTEMAKCLLSHYFLLTEEDMQLWESDPEGFVGDEGGESWKFSLKPCTEVLFLTLFHAYRDTLKPTLLQMVQTVQGYEDASDLDKLLQKEAIYNAVGLAAFELFDEVDFDSWFVSHLLKELENKSANYKYIRRRVIWLIGQWIGVKLSPTLHPAVYQAVLPLLSQEEDLVFLESSVSLLFNLLQQVSECDSKMHILHVLSFIIERVGSHIRPHASRPGTVPAYALGGIVRSQHVKGLGTLSANLYPFLIPVVKFSTDVSQPPHVYLLEDGLDLWFSVIISAGYFFRYLVFMYLVFHVPGISELGSENLKTCFHIVGAYVLLGRQQFMEAYAPALVAGCSNILSDLRAEGIVTVMKLIEIVFRVFPAEGPQLFQNLLIGVLELILGGQEGPVVMAMYFSLYARIILKNQDFFFSLLERTSQMWNQAASDILDRLLNIWVENFDMIAQAERRKLSALALTSLLTSNN
ncbi:putative importin-11, partial [Apostichopus japonicus]